jgi:hypothetical protein
MQSSTVHTYCVRGASVGGDWQRSEPQQRQQHPQRTLSPNLMMGSSRGAGCSAISVMASGNYCVVYVRIGEGRQLHCLPPAFLTGVDCRPEVSTASLKFRRLTGGYLFPRTPLHSASLRKPPVRQPTSLTKVFQRRGPLFFDGIASQIFTTGGHYSEVRRHSQHGWLSDACWIVTTIIVFGVTRGSRALCSSHRSQQPTATQQSG